MSDTESPGDEAGRSATGPLKSASEQLLAQFIHHAPAAIAVFDREMRYLEVSERWVTDYHLTDKAVIGRSHYDVFPDIPERWKAVHRRVLAGAVERCDEDPFPRADGTVDWLQWEVRPWHTVDGDIGGLIMLTQVITERKQAEQRLADSEARFRGLCEAGLVGVYVIQDGRLIYANPALERIFGCDPGELTGGSPMQFVHPDDRAMVSENMRRRISGETVSLNYEFRGVCRDGRLVHVEVLGSRTELEGRPAIVGNLLDVTARKNDERRIRHLNRLHAVLSQVDALIMRERSSQTTCAEACRIAVEVGEYRMAWLGMLDAATGRIEPVASAGVVDGYLETLSIGIAESDGPSGPTARAVRDDRRAICADIEGDPDYASWRTEALRRGYRSSAAFPLRVEGAVVGVLNLYAGEPGFFDRDEVALLDELAIDIGFALETQRQERERRRVEQAFRASEQRFASAFEFAAIGMALVAPDGTFLRVNRALCQMLGYSPDELCGRRFADVTHPDDLGNDQESVRRMLAGELDTYQTEKRYMRKDGSPAAALLSVSLLRDEDGQPVHFISQIQDITGRLNLETQLRQAQKLEAIGRLAGGVAHDFNNILAAIIMQTELAAMATLPRETLDMLGEIRASADRASSLTRQLLAFSRRDVMQPRDVDLNDVVTSLATMLRRLVGEDVQLELQLAPQPLMMRADPGMLDQVLMNLVVNSRDAMPTGGLLRVATSTTTLGPDQVVAADALAPGKYARLSVSDTGSGIPSDILTRIFDPFFTTKPAGKGTGLGLATAFGIVKQHGGAISVRSLVGAGSVFEVLLPVAVPLDLAVADATDEPAIKTLAGTILLVEDETAVRRLTKRVLTLAGYHVIDAGDGPEALRVWAQHHEAISLLMTDLVMPGGVGGRELAAQLSAQKPGLKVLLTSGYSEDLAGRELTLEDSEQFLRKPYARKDILDAVDRCLAE